MNVWHKSSTESKPCVVCGKKTAHYKVYEQSHITISIPLCDYESSDGREIRNCYREVDVTKYTTTILTDLKRQILATVKGVQV